MGDTLFEESLAKGGAHHSLATLAGRWVGRTRTWTEPGKLYDESPVRGTIRPVLDGRFVVYEYKGGMAGEPLQGMALIGYHLGQERYEMAWIDSWHMGTGIMFATGTGESKQPAVLGHYGDPAGGPPWGWRTEISLDDPDHLTITAYNITPDGLEAKAVETVYTREQIER